MCSWGGAGGDRLARHRGKWDPGGKAGRGDGPPLLHRPDSFCWECCGSRRSFGGMNFGAGARGVCVYAWRCALARRRRRPPTWWESWAPRRTDPIRLAGGSAGRARSFGGANSGASGRGVLVCLGAVRWGGAGGGRRRGGKAERRSGPTRFGLLGALLVARDRSVVRTPARAGEVFVLALVLCAGGRRRRPPTWWESRARRRTAVIGSPGSGLLGMLRLDRDRSGP